jgi:hypothetical protein
MTLLPATNKQVPEHSILDHFNKQVYLGNQYSVNKSFTIGSSEIALLYLNNSQTGNQQNLKALFQNLFKMAFESASGSLTLNAYLDAVVTGGSPVTPINMRPAYGISNIVGTVVSSPTIGTIGTLVDTISGSASQPVTSSEMLKILDNTQNILITGIGSGAGLLCNVILKWFEI